MPEQADRAARRRKLTAPLRAAAFGRTSAPHPALRGVSHQYACLLALVLGCTMVLVAPTPRAAFAGAVYAVGITSMLATSALYHRVPWTEQARARMRRVDHSMIYVAMAAMYCTLWLIVLRHTPATNAVLAGVALMTVIGVGFKLIWIDAPRGISAATYVLFGFTGFIALPALFAAASPLVVGLILGGAACEAAGAVIYSFARPDPWPDRFGFHELFHALIVVGLCAQSAAITIMLLRH